MSQTSILLLSIAPLAYLLGSIPFGLIVGRARGIDPRLEGSRNIGATNVGRLLGGKYFALVFTLDLLKSFLPCIVAGSLFHFAPADVHTYLLWMLVGVCAVLGHMFSIFLNFKGGKGVATSAGLLLGIWPYFTLPGLFGIAVFLLVLFTTRYVSASSIIGSASFPLAFIAMGLARRWPLFTTQLPLIVVAIVLPALIAYKHRANIARLRAGTESRIGSARATPAAH